VNGLEQLARHSMKSPKHLPGGDLSSSAGDEGTDAIAVDITVSDRATQLMAEGTVSVFPDFSDRVSLLTSVSDCERGLTPC